MRLTAHARCAQNSALFSDRLSGPILAHRTPLQTNLFEFEFKSNHFITLLVLNFRFVDRMLTPAFQGAVHATTYWQPPRWRLSTRSDI